jgi:hypothetical protein
VRRVFKIAFLASLFVGVCSVKDGSAQVDEDCGLTVPPMLMFKVRVDGRSTDRVQQPLTHKDFEVTRYQKTYEIDFFKEIESDSKRLRVFEIGVMLDSGGFVDSWTSDRMTVSIRSVRKTWGLVSKVLQRRIVEQ